MLPPDEPLATIINVLFVFFLVFANGFFVAAEFSLVAVRRSSVAEPVLAGLCVVAVGVAVPFQDLANHDRAVLAGIDGDLARRPGDRFLDNLDAVPLGRWD
jgi:hypothetical protein